MILVKRTCVGSPTFSIGEKLAASKTALSPQGVAFRLSPIRFGVHLIGYMSLGDREVGSNPTSPDNVGD